MLPTAAEWWHTPLVETQAAAKMGAATDAMLPTAAKGNMMEESGGFLFYYTNLFMVAYAAG